MGLFVASICLLAAGLPDRSRALLFNTALLVLASSAISIALGGWFAWIVCRTDTPGRVPAAWLLAAWLTVPPYLVAAAWEAGFGWQGAWSLANLPASEPWLVGWRGAIWVHGLLGVPWAALFLGFAWQSVPREPQEWALLQAPPARVARRVAWPFAAPFCWAALAWLSIAAAGEIAVTDLFQVRTYAEAIYLELSVGGEPGLAPLRLWPGVAFCVALVALAASSIAHVVPNLREGPATCAGRFAGTLTQPRRRSLRAALLLALVLGLVAVPLADLVYKAGVIANRSGDQITRHWSLAKCGRMVLESAPRFRREIGWSTLLATWSACLATATALALAITTYRRPFRHALTLCVAATSLAIPGPAVGLLVIQLFNRPGWSWLTMLYDQSIAAPVVALTWRALGPALLLLLPTLHSLARAPAEALQLAGASRCESLLRVTLVQRRPQLVAAWCLAWLLAWGDLATSILVLPPRVTTLALRISSLTHYGVDDRVAGICLLQVLALFLLVFGLSRLLPKR